MSRIIVGVDTTPSAARALDRGLWEAARSDTDLVALHAWQMPVWFGGFPTTGLEPVTWPEEARRLGRQVLDDLVDKALSHRLDLDVEVERLLAQGDPGQALVEASRAGELVVIGGRGHGPLGALLGSVGRYVLHHARGPVMVVPAAGPPPSPWRRVVVGVDGSPPARAALHYAAATARRDGAPLLVLHSWLPTAIPWPVNEDDTPPAWLADEVAEVQPGTDGLDVTVRSVPGAAPMVLLDHAHPDDLLVLGAHGRGRLATLLLGSVATHCVQHASSAVTVVRPG